MIKTILFDLDGTLLPMDQDAFVHAYFGAMSRYMKPYGFEAEQLVKAIWAGTAAMIANDGSRSNEEVFWECFRKITGRGNEEEQELFTDFYKTVFEHVRSSCGFNEKSAETIRRVKASGYDVILATNPIFPAIATRARIRWAGLSADDFSLITTYENSGSCKPNPEYYREIMEKMNLKPSECVMVGNDASEDMAIQQLGVEVFLLTDCLINQKNIDISNVPQGTFEDLWTWLGV